MVGSTANMRHKESTENNLHILISGIPAFFSDSFKKQAKAIAATAEKTENYVDHTAYKSVIQELDNHQSNILQHFNNQYSKALTHSETNPSLQIEQALNFHTDHLSLVTDSELEYQLTLESSFSVSENNFEHCLASSGWNALGDISCEETSSMLDCIRPGFLALLLQNSLDEFLTDKQVARITYRFTGAAFFSILSGFYDELISPLEALSKSLRQKKKDEEEAQEALENSLPQPQAEELPKGHTLPPGTNIDVSGLIKNWDVPANLAGNTEGSFTGFSDIDFSQLSPDTEIHTASSDDIAKLLRSLSEKARVESGFESESLDVRSVLKESLKNLTDEGILTVIDKVSENILNLVSHLFEDLGQNNGLIDDVVCQVSRIQASVMQVALTDSKMFQSADHPVRKYINTLGKLGVRVSDSAEEGYYELRDSVSSLLQEFNGDISTFEQHSEQLEEYIEESIYSIKWSDGSYDNEEYKNAVKSSAIQDFLESQQALLNTELNFHKLLKTVWGAILARVLVRKGIDSDEWNSATEIYSSTLWSTQVSSDDSGKREILRRLPKIIQGTRHLFDQYGLNPDIRDALQEQMIQMHLQIIRGIDGQSIEESHGDSLDMFLCLKGRILNETESEHNAEFDAVEMESPVEIIDTEAGLFSRFDSISPFDLDKPAEEEVDWDSVNTSDSNLIQDLQTENSLSSTQELDIVFKQINRLPLDTIFEFHSTDESIPPKQYKLNKKSIVLGRYTFKDSDGEDILEKSKAELALDILHGKAKRIEPGNIFDNALESVVAQMQMES
ncbi:hypothetical protein A9Q99_12105 [Gammaproteobacteria bacterium 45_16_T64]|nr:hypothetical protein A9Q99_12105 [Gammaproteobacteria bacterium 45_16_T64]